MKHKIAYILTTSALVMSAFLIGKTMSTNAKQYLAVDDIKSIDYYASENKITISTTTDSYDFEPTVINAKSNANDNLCEIYNTEELTEDILANRQGKLIIEKCVGKVLDNEKNGAIQNADSDYNYISYADVDCTKGDTVTTYLIYNPETNYTDDVIERFDYVQKGE